MHSVKKVVTIVTLVKIIGVGWVGCRRLYTSQSYCTTQVIGIAKKSEKRNFNIVCLKGPCATATRVPEKRHFKRGFVKILARSVCLASPILP